MKKNLALVLLGITFGCMALARAAEEPSLQEVTSAVHAGRLAEAQAMMVTVLRDHPGSFKAHFVDAEVLARIGRIDEAQRELARAEQLAPGLPSIKPEAVQDLRDRIAGSVRSVREVEARPGASSFPWRPVLLIFGAGALVFLVLRARRPALVSGTGNGIVPAGATPNGGAPYGAAPMGGAGIGSGILGGLATGAAVGAGMVAGEALAHELIGNHERDRSQANAWTDDGSRVAADPSDLGVDGNWDSGGSSDFSSGLGGDDWG